MSRTQQRLPLDYERIFKAVRRPHLEQQRRRFLVDMVGHAEPEYAGQPEGQIGPTWWAMWPPSQQNQFLEDVLELRKRYFEDGLADPLHATLPPASTVGELYACSQTLDHMQTWFGRVVWLVLHIVNLRDDLAFSHATRQWFQLAVLRRVSPREFNKQPFHSRAAVVRAFTQLLMSMQRAQRQGQVLPPPTLQSTHALLAPLWEMVRHVGDARARQSVAGRQQREADAREAAETMLRLHSGTHEQDLAGARALLALFGPDPASQREHGGGAEHSLAHGRGERRLLSPRQQAVYARRFARY